MTLRTPIAGRLYHYVYHCQSIALSHRPGQKCPPHAAAKDSTTQTRVSRAGGVLGALILPDAFHRTPMPETGRFVDEATVEVVYLV